MTEELQHCPWGHKVSLTITKYNGDGPLDGGYWAAVGCECRHDWASYRGATKEEALQRLSEQWNNRPAPEVLGERWAIQTTEGFSDILYSYRGNALEYARCFHPDLEPEVIKVNIVRAE